MRRTSRAAVALAAAAAMALGGGSAGAVPPPLRVAFLGAGSGPGAATAAESLAGLRLAVESRNAGGGIGAQHRRIEVLAMDDGDAAAGVEAAFERAAREKVDAMVAVATARTVDAVGARGRTARFPVLVLGSAAPPPTLDPASHILSLVPSPVEEAMALANLLALRSTKPLVGITGTTRRVGVVAEDSAAGRALADALARNVGRAQTVAARIAVAPRGRPAAADLATLRAAGADRLVVLGEPDLLDGVAGALAEAKWRVPVLAGAAALGDGAACLRDGRLRDVTLAVGVPQRVLETPATLAEGWAARQGGRAPGPRAVMGWLAADLVAAAAAAPAPGRGGDLLAALRNVRYGKDEASMEFFDPAGRATLFRFTAWRVGERGPEPVNRAYLPADAAGPLLGMCAPPAAGAVPATGRVVWVTFGDAKTREPRTIETDIANLGLADPLGGPREVTGPVLDDLLARTIGKFHVLFLREYDGSAVPGVSYDIHFTSTRPEGVDRARLWTVYVAGTGNPSRRGGSSFPGEGAVAVHATWLTRNLPALARGRVFPPLGPADLPFLQGEYPWSRSLEENQRSDGVRGIVDALAGAFAMKGAKELGILAGLSLDFGDDVRSIMNVNGGEGLRETNVHFTAKESKILERVLGRVPAAPVPAK